MKKITNLLAISLFTGIFLSACSSLKIDYEFNTGQAFTDIQGAFSEKSSTTYKGYMFYFDAKPDKPDLPWDTATLHSPMKINGGNDVRQCWNQVESGRRILNFYCGGSAIIPATPPSGTYQITVVPKTYTFNDVPSRVIGINLNNVYVPAVKLTTDSSGKITRIDWQWWKKTGPTWVQPTDDQLTGELKNAGFEIGQLGWAGDPATRRVRQNIPMTANGNTTFPSQGFNPSVLRMFYTDKAGFSYGFEWR